ncbi:MAG: YlxM family DNA-binding protein [Sporomusaceae bacterium]|nr:YlxM family DNA-binding protein [Sporomusaceae bacterium]
MLEKVLKISLLYDFYGALLTEKQQTCVELHYFQDLSLSEIAEQLTVSRQAVYDLLKRAEQILAEHEAKLQLAARHDQERQVLREIYQLLDQSCFQADETIQAAKAKLRQLVD